MNFGEATTLATDFPLHRSISLQQNAPLRHFLLCAGLALVWIGCDLVLHAAGSDDVLRLPTAYLLPLFAAAALILLNRVARQGVSDLPIPTAVMGLAFIVGGAAFDLTTTITHSPDLSLEGNPYVRVLLDSSHSLPFVYCHLVVTQSLYILFFCAVWLAFLRHQRILLETIVAAEPNSPLDFLKAATGGAHLTFRQWLLPLRPSEVPVIYHSLWAAAVAVVFGISLFRWYAGLEWLGAIEASLPSRLLMVLGGVGGALTGYFLLLWRLYRTNRPAR